MSVSTIVPLRQLTFSANANATVQCPVKPSTYKVSQTVELPKEIPKGKLEWPFIKRQKLTMIAKFSVAVRGYTDEDADMLCLDLYVDFVSLPSIHTSWSLALWGGVCLR